MEMLEWIPVEQAGQIETVCELAREIWTDRYLGAYGSMELDYLLRTWQSPGAVRRQIDGGYMEYRLICYDGAELGYAALREKEDALWMYHAYIRGEYHGNRTVTGMLELIERECAARGLARVYAVVDRKNSRALDYCERLGLRLLERRTWEAGPGFPMELCVFEMKIRK